MADLSISQDFTLDAGIFSSTKLSLAASTDASALLAVAENRAFPDGDIVLGHISFTADTGEISVKPAVSGASLSFEIAVSAQSGAGVYAKVGDAIQALGLTDTPNFTIPDVAGQAPSAAGLGLHRLLLRIGFASHRLVGFGELRSRCQTCVNLRHPARLQSHGSRADRPQGSSGHDFELAAAAQRRLSPTAN